MRALLDSFFCLDDTISIGALVLMMELPKVGQHRKRSESYDLVTPADTFTTKVVW